MVHSVVEPGSKKGFLGSCRYRVNEVEEETVIVFLDCTKDLFFMNKFLLNSLYVGGAGFWQFAF